jgi:ABC-type nickel/cobalt efflux system permease component RcnA
VTHDQLVTLALLGILHGINPGMGWLFAVSIGLQERSRRALLLSLPAIALGHEASIGLMILVLTATSSLFTAKVVVLVGGGILLTFGIWRLWSKRHVRCLST